MIRRVTPRGLLTMQMLGGWLDQALVDQYFTGTTSKINGVGLEVLAKEAAMKHAHAFEPATESHTELVGGGAYHFRKGGEFHILNPQTVSTLQHSVRENKYETFKQFAEMVDQQNKDLSTLRGLMVFKESKKPVKLDEVEPATEIVKRFASLGIDPPA